MIESTYNPQPRIATATREHARQLLATGLRPDEVREIEATGFTPEAILYRSLDASTMAWALLDTDAHPVAMFGVAPWPSHPGVGAVWFVSADVAIPRRFRSLGVADAFIRLMGEEFPVLSGYIDVRRADTISWLKRAGFRFDTTETRVGPQQASFVQFGRSV